MLLQQWLGAINLLQNHPLDPCTLERCYIVEIGVDRQTWQYFQIETSKGSWFVVSTLTRSRIARGRLISTMP
jgi:hypothetical protein